GNIGEKQTNFSSRLHNFKYFTALIFGLIHGLGFSNYLKSLLGMEQNFVKPLFAFNLGLEIGQIIIVLIVLIISSIAINKFRVKKRAWTLVLSGAGIGISVVLMLERIMEMGN
ncbi:MAG: hypothetical protein B6I20_03210, partial [Bacteroidetes bacterium 4572_117]